MTAAAVSATSCTAGVKGPGNALESAEAEQALQVSAAPEIPIVGQPAPQQGPKVPENPELVPEAPDKAPSPSAADPNAAEIARLKAMIEKLMPLAQKYAEQNPQEQFDREAARAASNSNNVPPPAQTEESAACEDEDGNLVGHEAARQRLRRMCTPKANGRLLVPKEVREKYVNGGADREKLLTLLIKAKFNKECVDPS